MQIPTMTPKEAIRQARIAELDAQLEEEELAREERAHLQKGGRAAGAPSPRAERAAVARQRALEAREQLERVKREWQEFHAAEAEERRRAEERRIASAEREEF